MIEKISRVTGYKKWILCIFAVLSFALMKSTDTIASNSAYGFLPSLLIVLAMGLFLWLVFEVLVGLFYSALKDRIENKISYHQFMNLFRFFVIFLNIFIFIIAKIIILINFYLNFTILFINLILIFLYLFFMWLLLKKYFLQGIENLPKICFIYFAFVFMYLFLQTIIWGMM